MNTAERNALEFLAGRSEWTPPWMIPNGRGRPGVTEKTLISLENNGWAYWRINRETFGWQITTGGRAALAAKETQP